MRRRSLLIVAAAAGWVALASPQPLSSETPAARAAQEATVGAIRPGTTIERSLRGGERETFFFDLGAGDFFHTVIEQQGVDVSVSFGAPDGTTLIVSDRSNGATGPERVAWVATTAGRYRIEVTSSAPRSDTMPRRYRLEFLDQRPASAVDYRHAEAERLLAEADAQLGANTPVSRAAARERYVAAEPIFANLGFRYEQGLCLYSLGLVALRAGEPRNAILPLTRARDLFDQRTDAMYASVVNALGGAFDLIGDLQSATAAYRDALTLAIATNDRAREAIVRNNIGKLAADAADWPTALDEYRHALALFQQTGDRRREGLALYNIGVSYNRAGDLSRAAEYLQQSLAIRRTLSDRAGEADSLTLLGFTTALGGDDAAALVYYEQGLLLRNTVGDRRAEGITRTYLGRTQLALGRASAAVESLERAAELRQQSGDRRGAAIALSYLAEAFLLQGDAPRSVAQGQGAVAIFRSMADRAGIGYGLAVIARAQQRLGRVDDALASVHEALAALESVRTTSSPEMRAAYLGSHQNAYMLAIDLLMQRHRERPGEGFDRLALQMNERIRARSLLDMLADGGAELRRGGEPALVERERQLARLLDAKADRLFAAQAARSQGEADTLAKEAQSLEAEYDEVRGRLRASSPAYSALTQPQPLEIEAIRRDVLDDDTTLVEYALGEAASYVWVLDRRGLNTYRLAPRAEIEGAAREAYELVTSRATHVSRETAAARAQRIAASDKALPAALRRVSDLVLAPIAAFPTTTRLLVVADGALQYLPFEMLPAPRRPTGTPLVTTFEITALPSASTLAVHRAQLARRPAPTKGVAVFADPVFDAADPRVRQTRMASAAPATQPGDAQTRLLTQTDDPAAPGFGSIARLRFTGDEAKAILAAAHGRQNLAAIGFDASKMAATDAGLGAYRYLHFATHGFLDTARPSLSAIALSLVGPDGAPQEGFLRAHELYNLNLSADLVVLSACETGLGKEIRGEGLIGLTRAFMYAGAARVIVSLWSVSDRATSSLMSRLYSEMLGGGRTPAASLRAAQLALRADARWQHPYYWAAFTIQGNL